MIKYSEETVAKAQYIADTCSSCRRCMRDCMFLRQQKKAPDKIFGDFVATGEIDPLVPYSCELCHHCTIVCPYKLEIADAFLAIRQDLIVQNKGRLPLEQLRGVRFHQIFSNFRLFTYTRKG
ncbi:MULTISPECIES: 4Fe-4S dicluster domain-containing protein [Loigolactobacillus]|uniref:4Fe-4S dicluster domain-containing protein n=1 Tax=Loigolactobacillus TaxID=2767889 RepID=UPI000B169E3F|nr:MULTISPECIES: 4Fe-4S dicluster domain-containing protein [Loigolactobacillus]MDA5386824.1 4Fe-4S dicluster domain-containing protein [Loigolactobacillus backii]MDA5389391.1 4Fe-4S dicluster domain-containing protein [Loigolactobacillus backii]